VFIISVGMVESKRQFVRPKQAWECDIRKDLEIIACVAVVWVEVVQG
jgi:hypothetical protein